jgi:hypothetical protein
VSAARGELGWTAILSLLSAIGAGLVASAIDLPAGTSPRAYLALVGGAAATTVPLSVGIRAARRAAPAQEPAPSALHVVMLGAWVALGPLAVLATLLKANTHHRPLAAATYAVVALALVIGALAVSARLLALMARNRRVGRAAVLLVAAAAGVLVLAALRRGALDAVFGRAVFQLVLVAGAAVFAARLRWTPGLRPPGALALVAWAAVVAAGAQALSDPALAAVAAERAPLLVGPLWMFV